MSEFIFIESRDHFESLDTRFVADSAVALRQEGHQVTVFLVQNGVLAARSRARGSHIAHMAEAGVTLLADEFSLKERGIQSTELNPKVGPSSVGELVDMLLEPDTKAIWH